jgi:hypothetical protein
VTNRSRGGGSRLGSPSSVDSGPAEALGLALSLVDGAADGSADGEDDVDTEDETDGDGDDEAGGRGGTVSAGLGRPVATSLGTGEVAVGGEYEYVMTGPSSARSPAPVPPKSMSAPGNCSPTGPGR